MQTCDPVKNLRLIRITLSFEGSDQHVGLFQGLHDALGEKAAENLFQPFDERLASPPISEDDLPVTFWFTNDGLDEFMPELNFILKQLHKHAWGFIVKTIDFSGQPYYIDKFQAALGHSGVITPIAHDFADTPYQFTNIIAKHRKMERTYGATTDRRPGPRQRVAHAARARHGKDPGHKVMG